MKIKLDDSHFLIRLGGGYFFSIEYFPYNYVFQVMDRGGSTVVGIQSFYREHFTLFNAIYTYLKSSLYFSEKYKLKRIVCFALTIKIFLAIKFLPEKPPEF